MKYFVIVLLHKYMSPPFIYVCLPTILPTILKYLALFQNQSLTQIVFFILSIFNHTDVGVPYTHYFPFCLRS